MEHLLKNSNAERVTGFNVGLLLLLAGLAVALDAVVDLVVQLE